MNIIKTIKKAAKAVIRTIKDLFGMAKANYEVKKAKAKAWHEFKKRTNPDYFNALVTILVAIIKIFIPLQFLRAVTNSASDGWGDY